MSDKQINGRTSKMKTICLIVTMTLIFFIFCFTGICLAKETSQDEEITLIHPVESKVNESVFDKYIPKTLPPFPPAPKGFDISPGEISEALSRRKHLIYIYADSKDYYVLFRQPPKSSMVKDYGFRIDGRTGEGYLPRKQEPNKFSLSKHLMNGDAELGLKTRYGTEADKLEASLYKKIRRCLSELGGNISSEDNIYFDRLSITVGPELKSAKCQVWGVSKSVKKSGRQPNEGQLKIKSDNPKRKRGEAYVSQPIKGQLKINYVKPGIWEISGSDDLEHVKIIYGTVADKLEKKFHDEIAKSLEKSDIRFDRIMINMDPDLKHARCWVEGLSKYEKVGGTEVWKRIKGYLRTKRIDRLNWEISGSKDIEHIKIDINIEQILSSSQDSN